MCQTLTNLDLNLGLNDHCSWSHFWKGIRSRQYETRKLMLMSPSHTPGTWQNTALFLLCHCDWSDEWPESIRSSSRIAAQVQFTCCSTIPSRLEHLFCLSIPYSSVQRVMEDGNLKKRGTLEGPEEQHPNAESMAKSQEANQGGLISNSQASQGRPSPPLHLSLSDMYPTAYRRLSGFAWKI